MSLKTYQLVDKIYTTVIFEKADTASIVLFRRSPTGIDCYYRMKIIIHKLTFINNILQKLSHK